MSSYPRSPSTTPTRNPDRARYARTAVHAVLDEALVAHVGFVVDGAPVVLPHLHVRVDDTLYLHGSTGARALRAAADGGLSVCVTVTLLDGLVLARSAFHHSVDYRSVVAHGVARPVLDEGEKRRVLDALVDHVARGRAAQTRPPSARELAATALLALPLEQASLKARTGGPRDDDADLALPHWAGVLPLSLRPGPPVPDAGVVADVPAGVRDWAADRYREGRG